MNVRDLIRLIVKDGWVQVAQKGSHRQFRHSTKAGRVTVSGNPSADVPIGTLRGIIRQAGLENPK